MDRSIATGIAAVVVSLLLAACGSPAPAPPRSGDAPSTGPAHVAPKAATSEAVAPTAAAPPAEAPAAKDPSEEALRASKSLEEPFPNIDDVTKEIGAPFAKGKATRRAWWFEKRPLGKTFSCDTIDLIRGPSGRVVVDVSVYTSDECKSVPVTKTQVVELLATLIGAPAPVDPILELMVQDVRGKTFDDTAALFEKKLGEPREAGEPDFAAWRYLDEAGECRVLFLTFKLGSHAGQAIWGLSCD